METVPPTELEPGQVDVAGDGEVPRYQVGQGNGSLAVVAAEDACRRVAVPRELESLPLLPSLHGGGELEVDGRDQQGVGALDDAPHRVDPGIGPDPLDVLRADRVRTAGAAAGEEKHAGERGEPRDRSARHGWCLLSRVLQGIYG